MYITKYKFFIRCFVCILRTSSSTRSNLNVTNTLMIVDQTSMAVSGVSPQVVDYTETKSVTVTGAGFIDTKEIACLFVKEINGQAKTLGSKMTASYINATQVEYSIIIIIIIFSISLYFCTDFIVCLPL